MTTKPKQKQNKKTGSKNSLTKDWSFKAIIICLLVFAIPGSYFLYEGIVALKAANKPVLGNRLDGQFDNVISDEHLKTLEASLLELDHIESVSSTLVTGTLRIALVTSADASKETITAVNASAYAAVVNQLPVAEYFHDDGTLERYDLEIAVHNGLVGDENFILQVGTKNADMSDIAYTFVTTPYSQEWVDELWRRQAERDEAAKPSVKEETDKEEDNEEVKEPAE